MATKYEYYITGDDGGEGVFGAERWRGQTFTPSTAHKITSVKLKLYRNGSPGTITVSIQGTSNGLPDDNDLCSGTTNGNTLPESWPNFEWREITLGVGTNLAADTQYAIVVKAPDGDIDNTLTWYVDQSDPTYAGGTVVRTNAGAGNWLSDSSKDAMFEDWGEPLVSAPTVTTQAVDPIGTTTATGKGNITDTGGENCDHRGIVYGKTSRGDPGDTKYDATDYDDYEDESGDFGTGAFTRALTGLDSGTVYYARAYAHNSGGYSYGAEVSFTTIFTQAVGGGSTAIAGSLANVLTHFLSVGSGSVAIAGALSTVHRFSQVVGGGSVAIAGALNRLIKIGVGSASVTIAGTLGRLTKVTVGAGSVAIAGALSSVLTHFISVGAGSVAIAGTLGRLIKVGVGSGSVAIAGSLTSILTHFISVGGGSVAIAGSLGRKIALSVGEGAITITGSLGLKIKLAVGSGVVAMASILSWTWLKKKLRLHPYAYSRRKEGGGSG